MLRVKILSPRPALRMFARAGVSVCYIVPYPPRHFKMWRKAGRKNRTEMQSPAIPCVAAGDYIAGGKIIADSFESPSAPFGPHIR